MHLFRRLTGQRTQGLFLLGGLFLLALLWTALVYHLSQSRRAEFAQTRRDTRNLSLALAEQVSRTITGADQVMQLMKGDFERDPQRFDFRAWLDRSAAFRLTASRISLFDANGDLISSSAQTKPATKRINIADRSYFQFLSQHPKAGLYVDRSRISRISNDRFFFLARRLGRPDAAFQGVLTVSINPDDIAERFRALDIGTGGSILLVGIDGYVRARMPALPGMYDEKMPDGSVDATLFDRLRDATAGSYLVADRPGHEPGIVGYAKVDGAPLVVTVEKSLNEVLFDYDLERRRVVAAGLVASLLIAVCLAMLWQSFAARTRREAQLIKAHDALREAETLFRSVFESSTDLLFINQVAPDGTLAVEHLNASAAAALECQAAAMRGKPTKDVFPSYMMPVVETSIGHVVATGEVLRTHRDTIDGGVQRTFEVILVPVFESDVIRRVVRVFVSVRDITHLREAEVAIARSEARYRLLADHSSDMIAEIGLDFRRLFVSPASRELLGFEPDELLGTQPQDFVHPDDVSRFVEMIGTLASGRAESGVSTHRLRRKDGTWVWVEGSWRLVRDVDGRPCGFVSSGRNVDARRLAEEAVRASEARFRLLAENTSELIMLGHDDGRRSYISPAAVRLLGFTPEELGVMRLRDYVHPDDLDALYAATRRLGAGESETSIVYRALRRDKQWVTVEGTFRRVAHARAGEPTIVATFRDVSEREAQSVALREAKDSAERAKVAAEQASQAKTDFLAAMSHEIRTPLNGILGYADILLEDSERLDQDQRRHVERIQNAGTALRTVVDDILDFSTIEAGQVELKPRPFRLETLIDNAASIVRSLAYKKGLQLTAGIERGMDAILVGDEDRLLQVLLNLLNNAVKFTPKGSIRLSVNGLTKNPGSMVLHLAVVDTGIGIADEKRGRLFERFSQVDGSTRREFGGTGLGLAISRSLVEIMGGRIGVDSGPSKGSTFWFEVELPVAAADALRPAPNPERATGARPAYVLLVEDHEINQEIARTVIEAAGHRVDIVGDGAAAVEAVRQTTYDVVLMDVQMPVMDGITATKCIRALDWPLREVPIIAMTANVLPAQVAELRAAGADDHVGKPFKRLDLYAAIDRWAGRDQAILDTLAIDRVIYDNLAGLLGDAALGGRVQTLADRLSSTFGTAPPGKDRARLAQDARAMTVTMGELGLVELADLMRSLEASCADDQPLETLLGRIASATRRALTEIAGIRSAA